MHPIQGNPNSQNKFLETYKETLDSHTIIVGDFNNPLSNLDRSTRQKINKNIQDLNSSLVGQVDLIDIYRLTTPNPQNIHSSQHNITPTLKLTT